MKKLIKNGQLLSKEGNLVRQDLLIEGKQIVAIGENLTDDQAQVIDAKGNFISPGFVDVHVHLREPGYEKKETILTGTKAAARGGFTQIAAMPNTNPTPDEAVNLKRIQQLITENATVKVHPYAAITKGLKGVELVDFEALGELNPIAFSDDGVGIQESGTMLEAMKKAKVLDKKIVAHCEDKSLLYGGVIHDGVYAKQHNIPGISSESESVQVARDILLAKATGCAYHVCHISTKESVEAVRQGKAAGVAVTAEVAPHHLLLCDEDIEGMDANYKMNPPLRSKEDREALIQGLLDGTIDCIATDHAPHTEEEKSVGILKAPFGIVGLETAFPLIYTYFVKKGIFTLQQVILWLSKNPAEIFRLEGGALEAGQVADLTIIDLENERNIDKREFLSKGTNTPFDGRKCQGWPVLTMVDGQIVWKEDVAE